MSIWGRFRRPARSEVPPAEANAPAAAETAPDFPYPLVAVPGDRAVEEWKRLRELWLPEGHSPVLVGDRAQAAAAAPAAAACAREVEATLRAGARRKAEEFFLRTLRELEADLGDDPDLWGTSGLPCPDGDWDPATPPHRFIAHTDILTGKARAVVYLARVPTARPWEIPAYLGFGGWNECPASEDQVAVLRRWHERHGAVPFAMVEDIVECWVARPPADIEACEALAREHFFYCPDIVHQGTQTLLALASTLREAEAWYFWWD